MAERVEPYDLGRELVGLDPPRWEPNAPEAFLVSDDMGRGALALCPHPDDPDRRCVVLRWDVVRYSLMGPPNDEALHMHRLYDLGLQDVLWLGVVRESSLVARLAPMWSSTVGAIPLHYVVVTKGCLVEVVAENVDVSRIAGTPREAAPASLSP